VGTAEAVPVRKAALVLAGDQVTHDEVRPVALRGPEVVVQVAPWVAQPVVPMGLEVVVRVGQPAVVQQVVLQGGPEEVQPVAQRGEEVVQQVALAVVKPEAAPPLAPAPPQASAVSDRSSQLPRSFCRSARGLVGPAQGQFRPRS
jgi:hypothetical protein